MSTPDTNPAPTSNCKSDAMGEEEEGDTNKKKAKLSPSIATTTMGASEDTEFVCDSCLECPLKSVRYRCTICPDFDLCATCFRTQKHARDHKLVEMLIPDTGGDVAMDGSSSTSSSHDPPPPATTTTAGNRSSISRMKEMLDRVKVQICPSHFTAKVADEFLAIIDQSASALSASRASLVPAEALEQIFVRCALAQLGCKPRPSADLFTFAFSPPEPACLFVLMRGLALQLAHSQNAPKEDLEALLAEMDGDEFDLSFLAFFERIATMLADARSSMPLLALGELRDAIQAADGALDAMSQEQVDLQRMEEKLRIGRPRDDNSATCAVPMRERSHAFAKRLLHFCDKIDEPSLIRTAAFLAGQRPAVCVEANVQVELAEGKDRILLCFLEEQLRLVDDGLISQRLEVPRASYFSQHRVPLAFLCKCVDKVLGEVADREIRENCTLAWQDLLRSLAITTVQEDDADAGSQSISSSSSSKASTDAFGPTPPPPLPPSSTEAKEMHDMVAKLKMQLAEAHERIDVLTVLLKETVTAPLLRALDRVASTPCNN